VVRDERVALGEVQLVARSPEHRAEVLGLLLDEPGDDRADVVERRLLLGDGRGGSAAGDLGSPRAAEPSILPAMDAGTSTCEVNPLQRARRSA